MLTSLTTFPAIVALTVIATAVLIVLDLFTVTAHPVVAAAARPFIPTRYIDQVTDVDAINQRTDMTFDHSPRFAIVVDQDGDPIVISADTDEYEGPTEEDLLGDNDALFNGFEPVEFSDITVGDEDGWSEDGLADEDYHAFLGSTYSEYFNVIEWEV